MQQHLKKKNNDKPTLIYQKHINEPGLIDSYGKNADEAYNKRNKILAESFKYMKEKTKGLNF